MSKHISLFCLSIAIAIGLPSILSTDDIVPLRLTPKQEYLVMADEIGAKYGVQVPLMKTVVTCESSWNRKAVHISKWEESYGLVQINLKAHPTITVEQAEDPDFALTYLAKGLSTDPNAWSCYRMVK